MTVDPATLKGRDFLLTADWARPELEVALDWSARLKETRRLGMPHRMLESKTVFLVFFDKSTRTRNSFEAGITQLGGHAHFIAAETSQIAHGESPKDMGIILSTYGEAIAIRHDLFPGEGQSYMREVAHHASVPVLNMQCDVDHPFQMLADLMTIQEQFGRDVRGLKVAVSWAYAPSYAKPLSVPQGLLMLLPRFGIDVVLAHPPEYTLLPEALELAHRGAAEGGGRITVASSMEEAAEGAHVVYAKSWGVADLMKKPEEALALSRKYAHWICDERIMRIAGPESKYMHCLPADRGNEVSDEVLDGPRSIVYPEAENRLHTCKAIMALVM
ncbi:MAG: ornithine carbamoyltransferase [Candidatus Eisenbacteria bacterium]|jgi:N-acetylornithine carbamoyltransferase|nr:ornithine carbamoyltransferase [Candidatus Eisenbacteria bacterium]